MKPIGVDILIAVDAVLVSVVMVYPLFLAVFDDNLLSKIGYVSTTVLMMFVYCRMEKEQPMMLRLMKLLGCERGDPRAR